MFIDTSKLTVGERINLHMFINKMNNKDLARLTGISANAIGTYVNGRNDPSLYNATRIAKALGVSLDYLAGLTDET